MIRFVLTFTMVLAYFCNDAQPNILRWSLTTDGSIAWNVKPNDTHTDNIEMSGKQVSTIVTYGVNNGVLVLKKRLIFPMLRRIPNDTHASLIIDFDQTEQPLLKVNGTVIKELPRKFQHKGKITIESETDGPLKIRREIIPSVDKPAVIEICTITNTSNSRCEFEVIEGGKVIETDPAKGVYGKYIVSCKVYGSQKVALEPSENTSFWLLYSGRKSSEEPYLYSPNYELAKRENFVSSIFNTLQLQTPSDTINSEFNFAKIRASESIFDTKGGLMHAPGGTSYYAAIWANDQAEYINPFFPFLGDISGVESAINSFRHFARYMNPEYKPIPSSIIAEGVDYWNGAGDRGDQAMIAYGASRFALAYGDKETAKELWPLIEWCLEYLNRNISSEGVIFSNSDELEGRFPAGEYNLSTNTLAYGGLVSASLLANELQKPELSKIYGQRAKALKESIERYFGANVEGFSTYRYYDGNTKLRAWICIPLTMGIYDRKEETLKALFSDKLWTSNGILTESGDKTFWDRATLYAFRGLLMAGATDKTIGYLKFYSSQRLLGEHVPYPIEAWPEGNKRHLSAESGLYCRVITEGLFGIEPTGFRNFKLTPRLPADWDRMSLKNIKAFQSDFDINVTRIKDSLLVEIVSKGKIVFSSNWDGVSPISIKL